MFSQLRVRSALLSTVAALLLLLTSAQAATSSAAGTSSATATLPCDAIVHFDRDDFSNSTNIDNKWLPLVPGTQLTLDGRANRGGGPLPHRVVFTVTNLTKVINGVRTLVVWDRDIGDGQLQEAELAFFAQDNDGNVWNLGEYPEEYTGGRFSGAPNTWIAGVAGSQGGIHMLARPRVGTDYYLQGSAPNIDFLDCAKVVKTAQRVCVPVNCYKPVLVTHEKSPLDPNGGIQTKYHAPGVGIIQIGALRDPEGETLVLTKFGHLSPQTLAAANEEALKLDRHGYGVSEVYRHTPRAELD